MQGLTLDEIGEMVINAAEAGDMDAARKLDAMYDREKARLETPEGKFWIASDGPQYAPESVRQIEAPPSTLGQKAYGAAEAALTAGSAMTTGMVGMAGGALKGAYDELRAGELGSNEAAERIAAQSEKGMQALTYTPKTEQGLGYAQNIAQGAEVLGALPPVMAEGAAIQSAVRSAMQAAKPAATVAAGKAVKGVQQGVAKAQDKFEALRPTGSRSKSIGAAQTPEEMIRRSKAESLLNPVQLTKGEATRDEMQLKFEKETAKLEGGDLLRNRASESQQTLQSNFDTMIGLVDGHIVSDLPELGSSVKKVLLDGLKSKKKEVSAAYKKADETNSMALPVAMDNLADFMNSNRASRIEMPILESLQKKLDVMEVTNGSIVDGTLQFKKPLTVGQAEDLIQHINGHVNQVDGRDRFMGGQLKGVIDEQTAQVANDDYQSARKLRVEQNKLYEDVGIVRDLIATKRGTSDQVVAIEKVLDKSILSPSADVESVKFLKNLLQNHSGQAGKQAWKDIQGSVLYFLRENSMVSATDGKSQPMLSPAALKKNINKLEKSGKLDTLFPPKIKNNLKLLQDVTDYVLTAPPGVINTSNTASTIAMIFDMTMLGTTGVPAPIASIGKFAIQKVKDKKLQRRILDALKDVKSYDQEQK